MELYQGLYNLNSNFVRSATTVWPGLFEDVWTSTLGSDGGGGYPRPITLKLFMILK